MQLLPRGNKSAPDPPAATDLPLDPSACITLDVVPPVARAIRKMMRQHRLAGLSVPQFRALGLLSFMPQASLSSVADYIGSSLPAASRMIDGLVLKKLVGRKECCHDRRQISLVLTPLGRSAFIESRHAAQHQLGEQLKGLSDDKKKTIIEAMKYLGEIFGSDADNLPSEITSATEIVPARA